MFESFATVWKIFIASLATAALTVTPTPSGEAAGPTSGSAGNAVNVGSAGASRNWSGYASTNGNFTFVTGMWTIPQVTGSGHTSADATWVGIGGVKSTDLIQAGTQNIISPSGQVTSAAFYELLPGTALDVTSLQVKPGDSMTATIAQQSAANQWVITIKDNTTNQNYQTTVTYTSSLSSAEWIEEAPSNGSSILPLDNFGTMQLTGGATTQNGSTVTIAGASDIGITMVNSANQAVATPSSLGGDGASFTVARTTATSNAPIPQFDANPRGWRRHGVGVGQYTQFPRGFRGHEGSESGIPNPTGTITTTPTGVPTEQGGFMNWRGFRFSDMFFRRHTD